ncbi:MAG: hypothetical protein UX09_C0001G0018 [Candidatus Uhrbacteria bacterium GW2011_GWE2_45_35]|uniref:Uncharacterized protein n=2 Tax=Candidatus Uhriibacteriota TaxID=1752732 RepID=A0A0G1JKT5_9BACT|nr:MAG: hypothetical protein UW63_C0003G0010 [Candidatus Uhrbacteria bacterium GW2011_GWF2_44_350]KKU09224.1 MAG: hypothetical protein UX09_C0001G0018 [Candidatus Uhrbacteria bacterium GW2011_GWE2_45_35]HBR80493.1 hypothetical protein [Candidatus Uhrbacteria bacterium]HCU31522.1 hypothetical protein [Candidatus Uhrbacteria bacterium]
MDYQFQRLLDLVRRTGDRLVVTDPNGEDTYVLMGLDAYEKIADRTASPTDSPWLDSDLDDEEDEYLDDCCDFESCNGDCQSCFEKDEDFDGKNWTFPNEVLNDSTNDFSAPEKTEVFEPVNDSSAAKNIWSAMPEAGSSSETWDVNNFSDVEQKIVEEKFAVETETTIQEPTITPIQEENESQKISEVSQESSEKSVDKSSEDLGEEQFYLEPIE